MAYIGNDPSNRFVAPKAASVFSGDGSTTAFTLDHAVGSDEDILVSVDGVIQEPSVAYAVSNGTTLTFTAAPSSNSGNNIFVYYLFRTVGTVSHPSNNALEATSGTFSGALSAKGGAVFNEDSADVDFRVESNGNANMLFVDAGNDRVHIGSSTGAATGNGLEISNTDGGSGLVLYRDFSGSNVSSETASNRITFVLEDSAQKETIAQIAPVANAGNSDRLTGIIRFLGSDGDGNLDELMRTRDPAYGGTMIGKTNTSASVAGFQIRTGIANGNNIVQDSTTVLRINRQSNDGTLVDLMNANNTEGTISISGGTVSYNAFSGSHWSRLSDNSKPTILKGTVIETIDEMCDWYQAEFTMEEATEDTPEVVEKISIALPDGKSVGDTMSVTHEGVTYDNAVIRKEDDDKHTKCKISDTADSTRVYGVYSSWDNDDDAVNDMYVTAVGTHVVRINKDVTVQAGDLLSSNGDGTAKVQDDDIIRSKTIGKVLTNIKQETYSDGSYTVPCALYCG